MNERKYIVISPHVDDLLVGNFLLCKANLVYKLISTFAYSENYNRTREEEDISCCKELGIEYSMEIPDLTLDSKKIYMLPSPDSLHPEHRAVTGFMNFLGMMYKKPCVEKLEFGYYSTDMKESWVRNLPTELAKEKKEWLEKYYPSQKDLWLSDKKYFLFEGQCFLLKGGD